MNETAPTEYNIPNTFAPRCRTQVFSVSMLVHALKSGFIKSDMLPDDVGERVQAEINRRVVIFDKIMSRSVHSELVNPTFNCRFKRM